MDAFHQHAQILNKFTIAQILLSETVVATVRKELRKLFPDSKIDQEQISDILSNEVLKREVIEGEKVKETQLKIKRILNKQTKLSDKKNSKSPLEEVKSEAAPDTIDEA